LNSAQKEEKAYLKSFPTRAITGRKEGCICGKGKSAAKILGSNSGAGGEGRGKPDAASLARRETPWKKRRPPFLKIRGWGDHPFKNWGKKKGKLPIRKKKGGLGGDSVTMNM